MKLLFDHQLSPKLAARLADLYPDSSHVCPTDEAEAVIRQQTQAIAAFLTDPIIGILSLW